MDNEDPETWTKQRLLSEYHRRCVRRRQEHLATLALPIENSSVLELGAGSGEHISFFLDRNCRVTSTDGREAMLELIRARFPEVRTMQLDLDNPPTDMSEVFDVVYCCGVLYQLTKPAQAIDFLTKRCGRLMFMQSVVTPLDDTASIHLIVDPKQAVPMTLAGMGCKPTRRWIFDELKKHFPFVYVPLTQPYHQDYPTDWANPPARPGLVASFVASREALDPSIRSLFVEDLPMIQRRH